MRSDFSGKFLMLWPTSSVWTEAHFQGASADAPPECGPSAPAASKHPDAHRIHIQAEGFEGLWTLSGGLLAIKGSPIALLMEAAYRNHSAIRGVHPGGRRISHC